MDGALSARLWRRMQAAFGARPEGGSCLAMAMLVDISAHGARLRGGKWPVVRGRGPGAMERNDAGHDQAPGDSRAGALSGRCELALHAGHLAYHYFSAPALLVTPIGVA